MDDTHRLHRSADDHVAQPGLTPQQVRERYSTLEQQSFVQMYDVVEQLSKRVQEQNGRLYVVGGAVRDELLGGTPKDIDLEVHGLTVEQTEGCLAEFGKTEMTGKSFGTYKLPVAGGVIEVALPRRDSQVGPKHTDVSVDIQPDLGITEAARRREFTIGAIYKDVLTGAIYDPFHGIDDLERHILRMVDGKTFGDDPLRVLRGIRHAARFHLTVESETMRLMKTMVDQLGVLPKDRLREEWVRLLTEPTKPSIGIELARELGIFSRWHFELEKLWQTEQDPELHPEGNVGVHTIMALDEAAQLLHEHDVPKEHRPIIMFGILLHDIGKPLTTVMDDDRLQSINHEIAGEKPAEVFMEHIGIPIAMIRKVVVMITNHLRPASLYRDRAVITDSMLRRLAKDVGPVLIRPLILVAEADHRGRGPFTMADGSVRTPNTTAFHDWWEEQIVRLRLDEPLEPIINGRELIEEFSQQGWKQGTEIGEALRLADELAVEGWTNEQLRTMITPAKTSSEAVTFLQQAVRTSSV